MTDCHSECRFLSVYPYALSISPPLIINRSSIQVARPSSRPRMYDKTKGRTPIHDRIVNSILSKIGPSRSEMSPSLQLICLTTSHFQFNFIDSPPTFSFRDNPIITIVENAVNALKGFYLESNQG